MTKVTRNVAKEVTRVQLSLRDEQQLSKHKDTRRRCRQCRGMQTITQTQRNRNTDADAMPNATNIKKNSSKNSEPLLSLLDLSEHKNWGVNFVVLYCTTGC